MDVASKSVTSTGTVHNSRAKLLVVEARGTATAGTVVLRDGGAGGTVLLTVYTPASAAAAVVLPLGPGIQFGVDVHASLTNCDGFTAVYQQ